MRYFLDSFSGSVVDLKPKDREDKNVLNILRRDPRVSTFDMSEHYKWLPHAIERLKREGKIVELDEPYPWHKFKVLV